MSKPFLSVKNTINKLLNIGVTPDMPFVKSKRVKIINVTSLTISMIGLMFFLIWIFDKGINLMFDLVLNIVTMLSGVISIYLNYKRRYELAWIVLFVSAIFITSLYSLLYGEKNGGEHYLYSLLGAIIVFFDKKKAIIIGSVIIALIYILLQLSFSFFTPLIKSTFSITIYYCNIIFSIIALIIGLYFFKNEHFTFENEIIEKNELLEKQKQEISEFNKQLSIKNNLITDSINYASKIQAAIAPNLNHLTEIFCESFVVFKPRNIVSGDFIWFYKVQNTILIAVADCTGHGVPGAFMSLLGLTYLNEIVLQEQVYSPNLILDRLRIRIKTSLKQTGQKGERQDGMDIAFCAIDLKTLVMNFAGAHNACWIFRNDEESQNMDAKLIVNSNQLIVIEADHMPIGIFIKEKPFTNQTFQLKKGDTLYIFSDGYHSQFGGHKNLPLKSKYFKELLSEICHLQMAEQKDIINAKFNEWKGENQQTDDVLVLGIKI